MSEDPKTYEVRSSEPLAQVEPESDYYRRQIRRIDHAINQFDLGGTSRLAGKCLSTIRAVVAESLRRPRSNGEAVDRLELELAKLRGDLIDYGILQRDHREAKEKLRLLWQEMGPVERLVRTTVGELAIRIDRWASK